MDFPLRTQLKNNQTLWSDYHKIAKSCGKDSPQAKGMLSMCIASGKKIEEENLNNKGE